MIAFTQMFDAGADPVDDAGAGVADFYFFDVEFAVGGVEDGGLHFHDFIGLRIRSLDRADRLWLWGWRWLLLLRPGLRRLPRASRCS